jgi:TrpR family transcriptional regulator, trp operon repressor
MEPNWDKLIQIIEASSHQTISDFLALFITPTEKKAIADRLHLVQLLLDGTLSQREIAKQHHISIAKITRGSNLLKTLSPEKRQWLCNLILD